MKKKTPFQSKILRLEEHSGAKPAEFGAKHLPRLFDCDFTGDSIRAQLIKHLLGDEIDVEFLSQRYGDKNTAPFEKAFHETKERLESEMRARSNRLTQLKRESQRRAQEDRKRKEETRRRKEEARQRKIAEQERQFELEKQRAAARKAELHSRKVRIRDKIFEALSKDYLQAVDNLSQIDTEGLWSQDELIIAWMREFRAARGKKPLSDEQLCAIGDCGQSTLLRARAGSGKTTVIKHKLHFVLSHLSFQPNNVMSLAFNTAAARKISSELASELNVLDFKNSRTFHSLAYRIVQPAEELLYDLDTGSNALQTKLIDELLREECNPAFKATLYDFFRQEMEELEDTGSLLSKEDYYAFLRGQTHDTLRGEQVKSVAEKWIADFLFEHDIRYSYERAWYGDNTGQLGAYRPDFSVYGAHSGRATIVLEHWGIDESAGQGTLPSYWSKTWDEYRDEMGWKRHFWEDWNQKHPDQPVVLLETSPRDTGEGREVFEALLSNRLKSAGFNFEKLPDEELIEKVTRKNASRFAKMCLQFIQRAKQQKLSASDVAGKLKSHQCGSKKERVFCEIATTIFHRYEQALEARSLIDFHDLLIKARNEIHAREGAITIFDRDDPVARLDQLKWLMIDEYQDFSPLFFDLVQGIRQYNPTMRIFCVGDDWQAINGFAGSDLEFFERFEAFFSNANLLELRNNYRSQPTIVEQGNNFMKSNGGSPSISKAQLPRDCVSVAYTNDVFIEQRAGYDDSVDSRYKATVTSLGEIKSADRGFMVGRAMKFIHGVFMQYPLESTSFLILNRTSTAGGQFEAYKQMSDFKRKLKKCLTVSQIRKFKDFDRQVTCTTIHQAKGAEADVVILLNCSERQIPKIHSNNRLFKIVGGSDEKAFQEEERLFYVALTRAKKKLYLLSERNLESEFLNRFDWAELPLRKTVLQQHPVKIR
jgi:DNA helicase-4